ncbi:MAG: class I SAM-dependent methyltransferase [Anaeromyxobacter sp.]
MRTRRIFQLAAPFGAALAAQLAHPRGWFGRVVMTRFLNRGNRALIEATLEGIPLSGAVRLLDVGFGGGRLLTLAAGRGVLDLTGVDPSEAAVAWLRPRTGRLAPARVRLERGPVEALPLPDAVFDVVASTNTVYFWPDLAHAFGELHRVTAPGGLLTLGFSSADKLRRFGQITRHGFQLHATEDISRAAAAAGFGGVECRELRGGATEGDVVLRGRRRA